MLPVLALALAALGWEGCVSARSPSPGDWTLRGEGVVGVLVGSSPSGCGSSGPTVGLWGDGFATAGLVPADVVVGDDGVTWVWFPLHTGVGEGQAAMRLEGEEARVPLGGRAGEFDLVLTRQHGTLAPTTIAALQADADLSLDRAREGWAAGAFLLREPGVEGDSGVVGEVRLRTDRSPRIALFDSTWLTRGLTLADRRDDGADLVLTFDVEPSLGGEEGRLRINVPRGVVVVPTDRAPAADDRLLDLSPGALTDDQRDMAIARAMTAADAQEAAWILEMGRELAALSAEGGPGCRSAEDVDASWPLLLTGYDARIVDEHGICVVEIEPARVQHRRRWRGRIGPDGERPPR